MGVLSLLHHFLIDKQTDLLVIAVPRAAQHFRYRTAELATVRFPEVSTDDKTPTFLLIGHELKPILLMSFWSQATVYNADI